MSEKSKNSENGLQLKIEIATQTLERNMGLISSCDNKASIVLALFGVLLGFILSDNGWMAICKITSEAWKSKRACDLFYLCLLALFGLVLLFGILFLAYVLVARGIKPKRRDTKENEEEEHLLFFRDIVKKGDHKDYREEFLSMSEEKILSEILYDIYKNSEIANVKYRYYNRGFYMCVCGFLALLIWVLIGGIVY